MLLEPHLFSELERPRANRVSRDEAYEIEQFLYDEVALLDSWRFEEWLGCLSRDIHYWSPVRENRLMKELAEETYAPGTSAHFDETYESLCQRARRVDTRKAWAESPPSRSRHLITNIRAYHASDSAPGDYEVDSNFFVYRTNGERSQDSAAGRRFDLLRRTSGPMGFELVKRTVVFDMAMILLKNLSLFY